MKGTVPVFLLSGFLGSGKTTLLTRAIAHYTEAGLKPAVIMNELGDVNLDGLLVDVKVPMTEMLSGCICCTVRDDLGLALQALIDEQEPDVILIESTGVANPLEIIDTVTEASLVSAMELKGNVTIVDCRHLLELGRKGTGKTFRLMQEQVRCATTLVLNKTDLVAEDELAEVMRIVREWNAYAPVRKTVKCEFDLDLFGEAARSLPMAAETLEPHVHRDQGCSCGGHEQDAHAHELESDHADHAAHGHHHHSHEHVMVLTHYLDGPIDSERFERFIAGLPENVYRGKGVLTFADTGNSRFLFQYAYREADFMKITPQGDVRDVVVLIGEHMRKDELLAGLNAL